MTNLDIVATAKRCLELEKSNKYDHHCQLDADQEMAMLAPLLAQRLLDAIDALKAIADFTPFGTEHRKELAQRALAKMGVK